MMQMAEELLFEFLKKRPPIEVRFFLINRKVSDYIKENKSILIKWH